MSGLNNRVEFVCPASACRLAGNGSSEGLVHKEPLGSVFESFGSDTEGTSECLPLGKGIAAPPSAACCSRVVCCCNSTGGCQTLPAMMPRTKGMMYFATADHRRQRRGNCLFSFPPVYGECRQCRKAAFQCLCWSWEESGGRSQETGDRRKEELGEKSRK